MSAGKVTSGGWGLQALERRRPGANLLSPLPCVPGDQGSAGCKVCAYSIDDIYLLLQIHSQLMRSGKRCDDGCWRLLTLVVTSLGGEIHHVQLSPLGSSSGACWDCGGTSRHWPKWPEESSVKVWAPNLNVRAVNLVSTEVHWGETSKKSDADCCAG